ncbi:unnamed protein product (macronuclear) [Paramecium tetraurelia]|uniref:Uncharacterized protein n=1 Tax=Paramecium tetraurelia TaxID=5888 RepID=A0E8X9_PARTE|nr:uncharacterized protein GSPATT00024477001 [Paramecium tetraurelia]CAK91746.1 unnamed protein product [Paramecium tetraurelia]|eukprot:XP_001459143.1 hypothetical protein (macronuclear) [Paramecium tetraurelia strain d4-2]
MNHEAESAPLIQEEYAVQQSEIAVQDQPKIVSINKLFLQNTAQAFSPGTMISKQLYIFTRTLKKSIEQYRNNESIQFLKNVSTSLEEFDGVSYSNEALNQDQSMTAKGFKFFGKAISKIRDKFRGEQSQQEPQGNQQQNRNESLIPEQSQRIDEEHV